ncbi:MAG: SppA protein [Burkholderiaceae bacterium]|nr:SppA protein [Burkholderiaceae bacterium]
MSADIAADTFDLITYSGGINLQGYESLCLALEERKSESVVLALATPGGDPHAGFRIARALHHIYGGFDALVPRYCKSAGTLILIGAKKLYLDDMSELGPLDVQVKKGDELIGRNSGLDIFQAVTYLQAQSMNAFRGYLLELTRDAGLSTRVASDIATRMTSALFEPIAAQIDPIKLAEMQRATEIAFEYGYRLKENSGNMRSIGIQKLVTGYPSHGFVIDRKEARTIFINVEKPVGLLAALSKALKAEMDRNIDSQSPDVKLFTFPLNKESSNDNAPDAENGSGSTEAGEPAIDGDSTVADATNAAPDTGAATAAERTAANQDTSAAA